MTLWMKIIYVLKGLKWYFKVETYEGVVINFSNLRSDFYNNFCEGGGEKRVERRMSE